jgi:hypothetical protein
MPISFPPARVPIFPWRELNPGSPTGMSYDNGQLASVTRVFLVKNDDLYHASPAMITLKNAVAAVLGHADYAPSPGGLIARELPVTDPDDSFMVARRCEIRQIGSVGDKSDLTFPEGSLWETGNEAKEYHFAVTFQHTEYALETDEEAGASATEIGRYMVVEETPAVEFLTIDAAYFGWMPGTGNSDGKPLEVVKLAKAVGIPVYSTEIRINWLEVPEAAINPWIDDYTGLVNSENLMLPAASAIEFKIHPPGTVLFGAPKKGRRRRFATGVPYRDLTLVFKSKPTGWNKQPNSNGDFYDICYVNNTTKQPFPKGDLNNIFKGPEA